MATKRNARKAAVKPPAKNKGVALPTASEVANPIAGGQLAPNETFTRATDKTFADKIKILNELRQKNPNTFVRSEDLENPYLLRRPTGIIELDIHLGGGFPAGGACTLSGPYGAGKSWLLWRLFAMQQRIYGNEFVGAIAHVEGAMHHEWIRSLGCFIAVPDGVLNGWNEIRRQRGYPALNAEEIAFWKMQIGHVETIQGDTGEEILAGVLGLVERNVCSVIGVDSISSLQPIADADKNLDDATKRAAHAMMMKQFWLRYVPLTRRGNNTTSLLLVQQVVANDMSRIPSYMQQYAKEWVVRGGESTKHHKLIDVVLWNGSVHKIPAPGNPADKLEIGKEVKYSVLKGKAGTHDNIHGDFNYWYQLNGTDMYGDLIRSAQLRKVIVPINLGHRMVLKVINAQTQQPADDGNGGALTFDEETDIRNRLQQDVQFEFFVRREVLAAAGVQCLYR
jgi:RecA/RadA recombinase